MSNGDVSTFEIIHSGLIHKLFDYLTSRRQEAELRLSRVQRIRVFLHAFIGQTVRFYVFI